MKDLVCLLAIGGHAQRCQRCRQASADDRALRELVARVPSDAMAIGDRERTLDAALIASISRRPAARVVPAGLALAAIAAAAVTVLAVRNRRTPASESSTIVLTAGVASRVGHALVRPAAGGITLKTGEREIALVSGSVSVEVDPDQQRPFRVVTPTFHVDVLGTVFEVDLDGVSVQRGSVRVSKSDGGVLVERLSAGERWSTTNLARAADPPEDTPVASSDDAPPEPDPAVPDDGPPPATAPARSAQAWIADARSLLADGDVAGTRRAVRRALTTDPPRHLRADAESLIAESYLRSGDLDGAITQFLRVAERYRDLATGEAALFAAARYELRLDRRDAGRRHLELYVARYPRGSLVSQAKSQLRALGDP